MKAVTKYSTATCSHENLVYKIQIFDPIKTGNVQDFSLKSEMGFGSISDFKNHGFRSHKIWSVCVDAQKV